MIYGATIFLSKDDFGFAYCTELPFMEGIPSGCAFGEGLP
jgi:hypothetical protein